MANKPAKLQAKDGWERSDFPIVCESCLGDNPYIRMMRGEYDKECKVCARPFTVFKWKPGSNARYKKTEICQTCAKLKNVCQTCLLDLEFGLPVQVRDSAVGFMPQSDINREWFADQAERQLAQGQSAHGKTENRAALLKMARTSPYYKRNEAHVCSFFAKGQCNRGSECPYRHEIVPETELSRQNIKDRYQGTNDPVALKMLGKPAFTQLTPPEDKDIKTIYVGNVDATITEDDIRDNFYAHGEIKEVRMNPKGNCAFVTFTTRDGAEKAVEKLANNLEVHGVKLRIAWGKAQIYDAASVSTTSSVVSSGPNYFSLPAPVTYAPPPNPTVRPFYPSMNPQRFGSKTDR